MALERYVWPVEEPKYAPNSERVVSVALRATDGAASVDVNVAFGKTVPVNVMVPVVGGEATANVP